MLGLEEEEEAPGPLPPAVPPGTMRPQGCALRGPRLTVDHLGRHPVGVAHHRVPLFPVWLLEAPRKIGKTKSQVVVSVLASEVEKYTSLGPSENQGPAPIPSSWLPPPSLSSGLCCHGVPMRPGEFMSSP